MKFPTALWLAAGLALSSPVCAQTSTQPSSGAASFASIGSGDVVGNNSGSSATPTDTTVTSLLDLNFGSAQGDVLYRGASAWLVLAPGTAGQVLKSGGAAANPAWTGACVAPGAINSIIYDAGASGACGDSLATITPGGAISDAVAGAASTPGMYFFGSLYTGGSGTTTFPYWYVNLGATAPTDFTTLGSFLGFNGPSGFVGDVYSVRQNGSVKLFGVDGVGNVSLQTDIHIGSAPTITGTCTNTGYVGGQTGGFLQATCTAQTLIFTFAKTMPNGYICSVKDEKTPADSINQTAHSTTSCTLTATTGVLDNLIFSASGA